MPGAALLESAMKVVQRVDTSDLERLKVETERLVQADRGSNIDRIMSNIRKANRELKDLHGFLEDHQHELGLLESASRSFSGYKQGKWGELWNNLERVGNMNAEGSNWSKQDILLWLQIIAAILVIIKLLIEIYILTGGACVVS